MRYARLQDGVTSHCEARSDFPTRRRLQPPWRFDSPCLCGASGVLAVVAADPASFCCWPMGIHLFDELAWRCSNQQQAPMSRPQERLIDDKVEEAEQAVVEAANV